VVPKSSVAYQQNHRNINNPKRCRWQRHTKILNNPIKLERLRSLKVAPSPVFGCTFSGGLPEHNMSSGAIDPCASIAMAGAFYISGSNVEMFGAA